MIMGMMAGKSADEQAAYNSQLMKSLGAHSMEEAISIIQTTGIQQEDINELIMSQQVFDGGNHHPPKIPPTLTRRQ